MNQQQLINRVKSGLNQNSVKYLDQFETLFKPIDELPAPEPFMNKPKSYPSQKAQQKQSAIPASTPRIQSC